MHNAVHLYGGFFQLGYVVRDLDQAVAAYQKRFGDTEFLLFTPPELPDGTQPPTKRIALAYIDDLMIELIEINAEDPGIFGHALPRDTDTMVLHHLGFRVSDHTTTLEHLERTGLKLDWVGQAPGMLGYIYADARAETGLYLEFIHTLPAGDAFFAAVPRNRSKAA